MAGIFKRISNYVLGGGNEGESLDSLLDKIGPYHSDNVRLYCIDPKIKSLMEVYRQARVSFSYNEKTKTFGALVENLYLNEDDDHEEVDILLPITKTMKWSIESPKKATENYICCHVFDYSHKKEQEVGDGTYQLEFIDNEKQEIIDQFEVYINDILDFLDKQV